MQCLTTHFSCETTISGPNNVRPHTYLPPQKSTFLNSNSIWKQWMKSHLVEIPLQIPLLLLSCETTMSGPKTPHFSRETTISGPDNVRLYTYTCLSRVQYQAPTMSDPTLFVRDYNIKPWQCQTTRFSFETTISGADNVRPHTFLARLQYHAPTMSDPTVFDRDNNIRPRQCQTPRFSCETTISGPNNVIPYICSRTQYQAPTMSHLTLFVREYNIRPRQCQTPRFSCETTISGPDNVRPHACFQDIANYKMSKRTN